MGNVIWKNVDIPLNPSSPLLKHVSLISMHTSHHKRNMLTLSLKFSQPSLMKKTKRLSVSVLSRRTEFLTSTHPTCLMRDPTLNGFHQLTNFLHQHLESSFHQRLRNTMETMSPLSRWTDHLTIFKNLSTSSLLSVTLTPSSTESLLKQCFHLLMLLDPTTVLVSCKQWLPSQSVPSTRRRPLLLNLLHLHKLF